MDTKLPPTPSLEPQSGGPGHIILFSLIGAFVIVIGIGLSFYFARNQLLNNEVLTIKPTSTSIPTPSQEVSISTTPNPSSIEDWKTYYNDQMGYSIRYPTSFELTPSVRGTIVQFKDDSKTIITEPISILISQVSKKTGETLDSFYASYKEEKSAKRSYNVAGTEGITFTLLSDSIAKLVIVDRDDDFLVFSLRTGETKGDYRTVSDAETTFDQMMASVKFLGPELTPSPLP